MGKMLMAKCRTLQEENDEIGNQANEGKMHELSMKLALQKSQNAELKIQFEGLCKQVEGLTNDAERSNEMVVILQEKLEEKEDEIRRLKQELQEKSRVEDKTELASDNNTTNHDEVPPGEVKIED
ncbi:FKBP12-interacting protein of 37 kDa [Abeliophyllum distichum]|uniref:FKBP12-interacting protein of 37 kDa n=1 Tax=Abeliophyllum distichum TaxID=126358 RepID=A0ABD1RVU5_9LAMI